MSSPFLERIFILGGPRGIRQKKLQNLDPVQPEDGPKGLRADIGSLKRFRIDTPWVS